MAHYDAAAQATAWGRDATEGRDPGDALEEAIDLWCYFLKLEGDPLAYRSGDGGWERPAGQFSSIETG